MTELPNVEKLENLFAYLMSRNHVKHAIVGIENEDRTLRWYGADGEANPDGTPMRGETPFHIASIDKLYTASAVMILYERGLLGLDMPLGDYLPGTLVNGIHRLGDVDYSEEITVRHLLSHTSGLADWLEDRPRGGRSFMERLVHEGDMEWTAEDIVHMVRDRLTPHFPPQSLDARRRKARYSDTNYQLLIEIVKAVTGKGLHHVFEEMLFRPLSLDRTYFFGYTRPLKSAPEPATIWFDDQPLNLPKAMALFPSIYSTVEDCLAFLRAFVRGDIFDKPGTLDQMKRCWSRLAFALDPAALRSPGWPIEYGLGLMRFRLPRIFTPLHPMPAVIGHTGSTGCWLFHCPELGILTCGTVDQASAGAVPYRFVPRLLRALAPIRTDPKAVKCG